MQVTEDFCKEQERLQLARAASEPLANRRNIALTAAKAWGAEAVLASKRALKNQPLGQLDAAIALEFASETDEPELCQARREG